MSKKRIRQVGLPERCALRSGHIRRRRRPCAARGDEGARPERVTIALGNEPSSWDVSLVEDGNMQSVALNVFEGLTARDST